jgi:thymidylate kinase
MTRRRAISVAIIGVDGSGKTTVARAVQRRLGAPAAYIYGGVSLQTSAVMLPTTRLLIELKRLRGQRADMVAPRGETSESDQYMRSSTARSVLLLINWIAEESYRQVLAWYQERRGRTVIFDRHFYCDYHARDIETSAPRTAVQRLHGWFLQQVYPKPDLVIHLDAPIEVLQARKPGFDPGPRERKSEEYRRLKNVLPQYVAVDAARPVDEVVREVCETIRQRASRAPTRADAQTG